VGALAHKYWTKVPMDEVDKGAVEKDYKYEFLPLCHFAKYFVILCGSMN
jgi:hypothetical protein